MTVDYSLPKKNSPAITYRTSRVRHVTGRSTAQGREQVAHLGVHLRGVRDRIGNLRANQFTVPLSQPVHGHAHGTGTETQRTTHGSVLARFRFARQEGIKRLELASLSGRDGFFLQPVQRP